ncbi:hypothetical protein PV327_008738 [Microctonus hyperodae]|uniref:Mutator-like transposase domain-containing protein n=1 Tax=Microctonus hyperodae TaxID=165561 RepID=A0AA39FT16_MICHY|nr:hypothetical protein PV327_008738 [Microctonus hyperodae]
MSTKVIEKPGGKKIYMYKEKHVSEKVYYHRLKCKENAKNLNKRNNVNTLASNLNSNVNENQLIVLHGRRLIDIEYMGKQMFCRKCKEILALEDIVHEKRVMLASMFDVKCRECGALTTVCSDKQHQVLSIKDRKVQHFDVNTSIVFGTLNTGLGNSHLNKILSSVDVPNCNAASFRNHEKEVGSATWKLTDESCKNAIALERQLTIENIEKITSLL